MNALAAQYKRDLGRELDPMAEIVTTVGATEAIFATMQAFVAPGDEVILMEPFYDSYPASVTLAGGVPVFVPLRPQFRAIVAAAAAVFFCLSNMGNFSFSHRPGQPRSSADWKLDMDELKRAVTPRTRMIVINTPHNPIGKIK